MSALNPVVAIGDDILDRLSRLPKSAYAKATKFIMRFRSDPKLPGINYERIQNAKDDNLRSVRIDQKSSWDRPRSRERECLRPPLDRQS